MTPLQYISFAVPGEPVPKGRPRFASVNGKARVYTPKSTHEYELKVALCARAAALKSGWLIGKDDACSLHIVIFRKYLLRGGDLDNCTKLAQDSCNGILYKDDARVVSLRAEAYASDFPRLEVSATRFARRDWGLT